MSRGSVRCGCGRRSGRPADTVGGSPGESRAIAHALTGDQLSRAGDPNAAREAAARALNVPEPFVVLVATRPAFQALVAQPAARIRFLTGRDGPYVRQLPAVYASQADPRGLFERGIQIGADNSIVQDGDLVMHRPTGRVRRIDYFHGYHVLDLLSGSTAAAPIAQVGSGNEEEDWYAHDLVRAENRRQGPFHRAVVTLQRVGSPESSGRPPVPKIPGGTRLRRVERSRRGRGAEKRCRRAKLCRLPGTS